MLFGFTSHLAVAWTPVLVATGHESPGWDPFLARPRLGRKEFVETGDPVQPLGPLLAIGKIQASAAQGLCHLQLVILDDQHG